MRRPSTPSPSLVISLIALFVALGGTSYAAVTLKRNSVSTRHLKNNSVTTAKVKNKSLRADDFAAGQLPAGARGPEGATGPAGSQGPQGIQGERGPTGTPDTSNFFTKSESDGRYVQGVGRDNMTSFFAAAGTTQTFPLGRPDLVIGSIELTCNGPGNAATVRLRAGTGFNFNAMTDDSTGTLPAELVTAGNLSAPVTASPTRHVTWLVTSGPEAVRVEAWVNAQGGCAADLVTYSKRP